MSNHHDGPNSNPAGSHLDQRRNPFYPPRLAGAVGDVDGKIIVVTGATGVVGRELVPLLITSGATVVAIGRDLDRLIRLTDGTRRRLSSLTATHPSFDGRPTGSASEFGELYAASRVSDQLHPVVLDLTEQDATVSAFDEISQRFGRIDAVIHLVGGWSNGGVLGFDPDKLQELFVNQLLPVANLTTAVVDHLVSSGGRFITVGSNASHAPSADNTLYASIKSAVDAWVSGLAAAFRDTDASATTLLINAVLTETFASKHPDRDFTGWTPDHLLARKLVEALGMQYTNGVHLVI